MTDQGKPMPFEDWLTEQTNEAVTDAAESHKAAMNSYGAGYDAGYLAALKLVADNMTPELAGVLID